MSEQPEKPKVMTQGNTATGMDDRAQSELAKATGSDREAWLLRMALRRAVDYMNHLPTCIYPRGCDCGFLALYDECWKMAQEPVSGQNK